MSEQEAQPREESQNDAPAPTIERKTQDIKKTRINKEMEILDLKIQQENRKHLQYQHFPDDYTMVINKMIKINYGEHFPFEQPSISFLLDQDTNGKYDNYLCLFDLNKLEFRDIMKEDYHPSLNFAEIAERSIRFLDKIVIKKDDQQSQSVMHGILLKVQSFEKNFAVDHSLLAIYVTILNLIILVANTLLFPPSVTQDKDSLKKTIEQIQKYNPRYGIGLKEVDPFADNLVVFYFYKLLAFIFSAIQKSMYPTMKNT